MKFIKMICPNCGAQLEFDGVQQRAFCKYCGTELMIDQERRRIALDNAEEAGYQFEKGRQKAQWEAQQAYRYASYPQDDGYSDKDRITALLLCLFLGIFGAHHFYAGRTGMGIAYIFTAGLFGIGWFVDIIMIVCGSFKDSQGRYIK